MKLLIHDSNNIQRKKAFRHRFYLFTILFFIVFTLLGYNLYNYKKMFIYTFISYFILILIFIFLCPVLRLLIRLICYCNIKNTKIIFWKDNLYLSVYCSKSINKYRHLISIVSPLLILTIIPIILNLVYLNKLSFICLASVNLLYSSIDLYNFFRILNNKENTIRFNGIDIINSKIISRSYKVNLLKNIKLKVIEKRLSF